MSGMSKLNVVSGISRLNVVQGMSRLNVDNDQNIATIFSSCITLYMRFLLILTSSNCDIAQQVDLASIKDDYGRLNVWGSENRALRTGRGSLDDGLRDNGKLRSLVLDLLVDLADDLENGMIKELMVLPRLTSPKLLLSPKVEGS